MSYESTRRRLERLEREAPPPAKVLRFRYEADGAKRRRLMELIALAKSRGDGRPDPALANMTEADLLEVIGATAAEFDVAARDFAEMLHREGPGVRP